MPRTILNLARWRQQKKLLDIYILPSLWFVHTDCIRKYQQVWSDFWSMFIVCVVSRFLTELKGTESLDYRLFSFVKITYHIAWTPNFTNKERMFRKMYCVTQWASFLGTFSNGWFLDSWTFCYWVVPYCDLTFSAMEDFFTQQSF